MLKHGGFVERSQTSGSSGRIKFRCMVERSINWSVCQDSFCRNLEENASGRIAKELVYACWRVREILKISQEPVSLETLDRRERHLGDFIQDDNVPVPAAGADAQNQLDEVLDTLTERGRKVRLRFGMKMTEERTLEEVGKELTLRRHPSDWETTLRAAPSVKPKKIKRLSWLVSGKQCNRRIDIDYQKTRAVADLATAGWWPISERIMTYRFSDRDRKMIMW